MLGKSSAPAPGPPVRNLRGGPVRRPGNLAGLMADFLGALEQRVLILDGAFGTWIQDQGLAADDFGGPDLEGCNEHLVLTRPDVIAAMHRSFLELGVDGVETATFGAFGLVL